MDVVGRFLNFDRLMGQGLVKIVYYLGLLGIALGVIGGIFTALGTMFTVNFVWGLWLLIMAPFFGVIAVCFLRFACELYIVLFRMGEDIAALRAAGALKPPASPPPV